jgi:predicted DNA-binding transcriptional regulator AlpA
MDDADPPDSGRQINMFAAATQFEPSPPDHVAPASNPGASKAAKTYAEASQARVREGKRPALGIGSNARHGAGASPADVGVRPQAEATRAGLGVNVSAGSAYTPAKFCQRQRATKEKPGNEPRLIDAAELAFYLGRSESTIWRLIRKEPGFPQPIRIGGSTHWDRHAVDAYLDRLSSTDATGR